MKADAGAPAWSRLPMRLVIPRISDERWWDLRGAVIGAFTLNLAKLAAA